MKHAHVHGQSATKQTKSAKYSLDFTPFTGTVYLIPKKASPHFVDSYYSEKVLNYEILHESITLEDIMIPNTKIDTGSFPGVERTTRFGMILYSELNVAEAGFYEFSLHSDDGSIVWIDGQEVVNNDGNHQMRMMKDTFAIQSGTFEAKIWYFQGLPTRFGFEFDHQYIGPPDGCENSISRVNHEEALILDTLHFEYNQDILSANGITYIQSIGAKLSKHKLKEITIIGHTDNVGTEVYNLDLSQRRAASVMRVLRDAISDDTVQYLMIGRGSSEPVDYSDTDEGRAKNRRVEIMYK